jgi:two-component sensor histidine kinase
MVSLDMAETIVDGDTARRVMMIAAELVQNAICHALENRRGTLGIVLRHDDREVRLAVIDDGPGIRAGAETRGSGMGRHIVAELVRRGGGELKCESGPRGTSIRVSMPRAVVARTAE